MSYGLVFGALVAVLLFVGFIGGLVWWVRRPISSRRHRNDGLPLFGHDRAAVYPRAEDDNEDEDDRAQLIMAWAPGREAQRNGAAAGNGMVRYNVPADSTLPFLPGRLAIVGGPDVGRDIRFVRTPGREAIDVTFGRNDGAPYRHVQLHDATVSRAHARMRFRDGRWLLANLSVTNPVLYNGGMLESETDVALEDGDRIEMGEVVFRFHV